MSVLDHALISERYFFPRREPTPDCTWVEVDGARLACHHSRRGHPFTLVHFHGNGEVVSDYVPDFVDLCTSIGVDCFLAEYRGYGDSTGRPMLRTMLDDIPRIFEAVRRPPSEIIVFGRSVGSIYAIEFASRYPVAGLVLESGIADPGERILMRVAPEELGTTAEALDAEFREHFDHSAKLAARELPTLVMHARQDSLVNFSHSVRLAEFPKKNVRLVLFPHGDHNTIFGINRERYLKELEEHVRVCANGSYMAPPADDTLDGDLAVFERTREFLALEIPQKRRGPGQTEQLRVPDALRERNGPGETMETHVRSDDEES